MNDWEYWFTLVLELDGIGVRGRKKSCTERLVQERKQAISKIRGIVSMRKQNRCERKKQNRREKKKKFCSSR